MRRDRNHEGYHDPTACQAVRNVARKPRKGRSVSGRLTYRIGETKSFLEAVRVLG